MELNTPIKILASASVYEFSSFWTHAAFARMRMPDYYILYIYLYVLLQLYTYKSGYYARVRRTARRMVQVQEQRGSRAR